jgi:glycosyltransferase involved in cell wall biosynthesis
MGPQMARGRSAAAVAALPTVLFIHPSDEMYGADRILLRVLDALEGLVRPVVVLPRDTDSGALSGELADRGIRVLRRNIPVLRRRYLSARGLVRYGVSTVQSLAELVRAGRQVGCVAVHTNTSAVLIGPLVALLLRVDHIWHIHEIMERPRWLARLIAGMTRWETRRVVAVSAAVASRIRLDGGRVTDVILNPAPEEPDPGPPPVDADPVVLMAGRVNGWKGHDVFVSACEVLHREGVRAVYEIVGGPVPGRTDPYDQLRDRVERLDGRAEWIRFDGWTDSMSTRIARASVVVLPSTGAEPFNITALEAMALRRPVVATRTGGLPEVVIDGETGLLVPVRDVRALADAIRRLVQDPALMRRMGTAGCERARTVFSGNAFDAAWQVVYQNALHGAGFAPVKHAPLP